MTTDPRARWAEELSVPADAPPGAAVEAFLRGLPAEDFLPPPERVAAVNALAGASAPVGRDYSVDQLLRDEVDAFAGRYWDLPPAERLAVWADLSRRGADPARLRELEPGLDVATDALADPDADELAGLFRSLFVLPPRARAVRRNSWLTAHSGDGDKWGEALAALRWEAPALVALDPQLAVALSQPLGELGEAAASLASDARRMGSVAPAVADFATRVREYDHYVDESVDQGGAKGVVTGLGIGFLLLTGVCIISAVGKRVERGDDSYRPPRAAEPSYSQPSPPEVYRTPGTAPGFTPEQVEQFKRHERDLALGASAPAPVGYEAWVLLDRPEAGTTVRPTRTHTVTFDQKTIRECQDYDLGRGRPPVSYRLWCAAGKPTSPGPYAVPLTTP